MLSAGLRKSTSALGPSACTPLGNEMISKKTVGPRPMGRKEVEDEVEKKKKRKSEDEGEKKKKKRKEKHPESEDEKKKKKKRKEKKHSESEAESEEPALDESAQRIADRFEKKQKKFEEEKGTTQVNASLKAS